MSLNNEIISEFAKLAMNKKETKPETVVQGTVTYNGKLYVKLDGSDLLTPAETTIDVADGDRVNVTIKDHSATITGSTSSPAAKQATVAKQGSQISDFEIVVAYKVTADNISTINATIDNLLAKVASVTELSAVVAEIETLRAKLVEVEHLTATDIEAVNAQIGKLTADIIDATGITTDELNADYAEINELKAYVGDFTYIIADELEAINANIKTLNVDNVTINKKLTANEAAINTLKTNSLTADSAVIKDLTADVADIDTLIFGVASGDVIQTSFANAVIAQLGNAQIKSAMIESVSADKITAGDIITNNVQVRSEDGKLLISDETIQISDDTRVRVQIGKDASGDYSINIWDPNGNLMFSEGGITDSAIKNAIIRDDMVSETANISATKLDIDSLFTEINNSTKTIKSTKIYLDDKNQTLDVAFTSMSNDLNDTKATVKSQGTQLSVVQGKIGSKVWQQDINAATGAMSTKYSELEQSVNGISATVTKHTSDLNRLEVSGRNLIVRKDELIDTYVIADGTVIDCETSYYSATMADYISIEGGTTYAFSKVDSSPPVYAFRWAWYDSNKTVIGRTYTNDNVHSWTAPENAAYLRVSYPYPEGFNPKLEKGSEATGYSPALEDIGEVVSDLEASIQVSEDKITSTVSETYVTKTDFNDLEIGGTNLIQNSDFSNGTSKWVIGTDITAEIEEDSTHGQCIKLSSTVKGSSTCRIYPSTTENFIHKGGTYSLSFYAKADSETTMQTNVAGGTEITKDHSLSTSWQRFTFTYEASAGSITFWPNEANTTIYIAKVKAENGEKCTAWTPAKEDVDGDIKDVNDQVDAVDQKVVAARSVIDQLSHVISMLVVDENGTTLLNQTAEGWTFNMASIKNDVTNASASLNTLAEDLDDLDDTVDVLNQSVASLNELSEYVSIGTYQDTPPHLHIETAYNGSTSYRIYYDTVRWAHQVNTEYTLTFRARSSTSGTVLESCVAGQYNLMSYVLDTDWQTYTYTYTTTEGGSLTFWLKFANTDADIADLTLTNSGLAEDASASTEYWYNSNMSVFTAVDGSNIEPCIELGEKDSNFKLLITNTKILFKNGDKTPSYIHNEKLITKNVEVLNEIRIGNLRWAVRSNGNIGLMWMEGEI